MAKTLQFRRGTTSELGSVTGSVGELFVNTEKDTVVVMDGSTSGGFELVNLNATQILTNKTLDGATLTGTLTAGGGVGTSGQVLKSTGIGVEWGTVSGGGGSLSDVTQDLNITQSEESLGTVSSITTTTIPSTQTTYNSTDLEITYQVSYYEFQQAQFDPNPGDGRFKLYGNLTTQDYQTLFPVGGQFIMENYVYGNIVSLTATVTSFVDTGGGYWEIQFSNATFSSGIANDWDFNNFFANDTYNGYISLTTETPATSLINVNLDNTALPTTSMGRLLVNGQSTILTATQNTYLESNDIFDTINGTATLAEFYEIADQGNGTDWRLSISFYDVNAGTSAFLLTQDLADLFPIGNEITYTHDDGGSDVVNATFTVISHNLGTGSAGYVELQLTSGSTNSYNNLNSSNQAFMNASLTIWQQVEYKTRLNDQLDSITGNAYIGSDLDQLFAVNDVLTYIPKTTSLSFVNTDSTLTKSISYDNETGEITYGGLAIPIIIQEVEGSGGDNLLSSNAQISTIQPGVSDIIALGATGTIENTLNNTIIIGNQAQSNGSSSVGIGFNSFTASEGVAIGYNTNATNFGTAIGSNSRAADGSGAIALGYNALAGGSYSIAIGYDTNISTYIPSTRKIAVGKYNLGGPNFLETTWSRNNFSSSTPQFIGHSGNSATTNESTSSSYAKQCSALIGNNGIFNGKVKFIMRYYNDDASTDIRIAEQDVTLFKISSNNYTLVTGALNDLYNGGGSNCSQWQPSLVMHTTNPNYLLCKFDPNGTSVGSGIQIYAILSGNAITY